MPSYSFWQEFDDCEVVVQDSKHITGAKLSRDANYNIRTSFSCTIPPGLPLPSDPDSLYNSIFEGKTELKARSTPVPIRRILISGILITSTTHSARGSEVIYSGMVDELVSCYDTSIVGQPEYVVYWFLNGSRTLSYTESVKLNTKLYEKIEWGTFAEDTFNGSGGKYLGWDAIKLKYKDYSFLFGRVRSECNNFEKSSFIRFEKNQFPTVGEVEELTLLLSYVLGVELIYTGFTQYTQNSSPVSTHFKSTFRMDVESIIGRHEQPPMPIRISDYHSLGINSVDLINSFFTKFLEWKVEYNLEMVLWYLNYARYQHPLTKIQPLAAGFDTICSAYYSSRSNTHIQKDIYKEIMQEVKRTLEKFVPDKALRILLNGKISNCNTISMNKRNYNLFTELQLELSSLESSALHARNKVIHGSFDGNSIESVVHANVYTTLMNRLLLRLLGIEYYIDYSRQGRFVNSVQVKQGGSYNVRTL